MSVRIVLLGLACASLLAATASPAVASQTVSGPAPSRPSDSGVLGLVAGELGVRPELVRVEISGGEEHDPGSVPVDSVAVRRGSGDRWLLTSWVEGRASVRFIRVGVVEERAVAARDLPRGHVIGEDDVARSAQVRWGPDTGTSASPVGQVTERAVRAGDLLEAPGVRPPLLVRGGEAVEALFDDGTVRMSMRATALASAREGGRLHVRLESGRRLEAVAVNEGVVRLHMGGGS